MIMENKPSILSLADRDVESMLNYEFAAELPTMKLFQRFTLDTILLKQVVELREVSEEDLVLNWFSFFKRRLLCPIYTLLLATEKLLHSFMRLRQGLYIVMNSTRGLSNV